MKTVKLTIEIELPSRADVTPAQVWDWVAFNLDYTGHLDKSWLQGREVGDYIRSLDTTYSEGFQEAKP